MIEKSESYVLVVEELREFKKKISYRKVKSESSKITK